MPRKLRRELPEHVVRTVQEEGWDGFTNGQLLGRAAASFDVLLTADQRLRYQQNIPKFDIGIVVLETHDTTLSNLRMSLPQIRAALESVAPGTVVVVKPT
jgi:hypothetical protein